MHSSRRPRRRSVPVLPLAGCVFLALGVVASCADDAARVTTTRAVGPARVAGPGKPGVAADAAPAGLPLVDVGGRVVGDREEPVVGRPIVVVDRRGKRQEVVTDEEGGFSAMQVAPPYDLLVAEAPSGAVITPLVYLGLRRADPRLEVFERQGPTEHPAGQPLRVGVRLPPCRAAGGACWVSVVSASPSGGGGTASSYIEGTETAVLDLDHAWREPTTRQGESIDVHVLVGDAQYTEYAYARIAHVAVRPGEPTDLGMTAPMPVASTEPVTVAGHAKGLPEGWRWTLASQLDLPDGASIALRYDWAAASSLRLPKLPGATWHVGAWAQHPPTPERAYFHRSSQAWTGTLPLGATNVSLDVPLAPATTRPLTEGQLSVGGEGIAWDGREPALASLVLVDLARGAQRFRAFTAEPELALDRLEALGLPRLERGEHVLDLTTTPGANVDELTQPDEQQRRGRFDTTVPGAATYQRFRFAVTR
jgi:hypothetical protein